MAFLCHRCKQPVRGHVRTCPECGVDLERPGVFRILAVSVALIAAVIAFGLVVAGVYKLTQTDETLFRIAANSVNPGRFAAPQRL